MNDVADNNDVFSGSNYAKNYRKGRPTYPSSLIDGILTFLKEKVSDMYECKGPLLIFHFYNHIFSFVLAPYFFVFSTMAPFTSALMWAAAQVSQHGYYSPISRT